MLPFELHITMDAIIYLFIYCDKPDVVYIANTVNT